MQAAGFKLEAMAPRGRFVLADGNRPVVLISGGVGLTPMIAMAEHIVAEGQRTGQFRPVYFIHGTRNSRVHAFARSCPDARGGASAVQSACVL